jgi:rhodanese-related sulfurtransferase
MYHKINASEAKKIMDSGEDISILDVRYPDELVDGYIEDSVLIPVDLVLKEAEEKLPDKNKKVLVYCRSGRRSVKAAKQLCEMGYKDVYDFGGIMDWPFEIVM